MPAVPRTRLLLLRRFLADYARNPVNVLMLVLVPAVFTGIAAGSLAAAAKLLGGPGGTAVASAAAITALAVRTGIADPARVLAGTAMAALIYLAIGAVVGALITSPVNGTVLIFLVWAVDVFFGPAFGSADRPLTWGFPTHYVTLWMTGLPSDHAGPGGGLGFALAWTIGASAIAGAVLAAAIRPARSHHSRPDSVASQFTAGLRTGLLDISRNRVLWALLVVVPVIFVALTPPITPRVWKPVTLLDHAHLITRLFWFPSFHPGIMAPIAIGFLATMAGLFIITGAWAADRRLVLAGLRTGTLLAARLAEVILAATLATAAALAVTAIFFQPRRWAVYAAASILVALIYALIGVVLGPLFGRVAGVFIAFLIPGLDLAIAQDPMLYARPPAWAHLLPGYGPMQILLNGALTSSFNQATSLVISLAWLAGLLAAAAVVFRHAMGRSPTRAGPG